MRPSLTRSQRDFNKQQIINLQESVSVRTYYIDLELSVLVLVTLNTANIRHEETSNLEGSRPNGRELFPYLFRGRSLGGNLK